LIKAILAVDEKGGVGKSGSIPWSHNKKDMDWFRKSTEEQIVIMGRATWADLNTPTPLTKRINVLVTAQNPKKYPGADIYIKGNLKKSIKKIAKNYPKKIIWIIGGPFIVNQLFPLIEEFYLTRIYGNYYCDTYLNLNDIKKEMTLSKSFKGDDSCHFEIWKR